jgi:hypothetical protein
LTSLKCATGCTSHPLAIYESSSSFYLARVNLDSFETDGWNSFEKKSNFLNFLYAKGVTTIFRIWPKWRISSIDRFCEVHVFFEDFASGGEWIDLGSSLLSNVKMMPWKDIHLFKRPEHENRFVTSQSAHQCGENFGVITFAAYVAP